MADALVSINNLKVHFFTFRGVAKAVDGISFDVQNGKCIGLVGESGSGKSVTGMAILGLIQPPGKITRGKIKFHGTDLVPLPVKALQGIRGTKISMIFQNPRTCLNPLYTIGEQIDRVYCEHFPTEIDKVKDLRLDMLAKVGIGDPISFSKCYPHEVSGGMCQRAMIVMALICQPELVIADEPTTGLDVTVQKQIIDLLVEMRFRINATQILITHDMGVVAESCDEIVVLYSGKVMEIAKVNEIFNNPQHPYTRGLLESIPRMDLDEAPRPLPGYVPNAIDRPVGCPFQPRCNLAERVCQKEEPEIVIDSNGHQVACHLMTRS